MRPPRNDLLPILAALATAIALFALAAYQITTERAAARLLGRFSAALIEVDRWLPEHKEDLELAARDRPDGMVNLGVLPLPVTLPAAQVIGSGETELRDLIVARMAGSLYEEGNGAFRDADGASRSPGIDELAHWAPLLLSQGAHGFWTAALPLTLLVLLAFSAAVLHSGRSLPLIIAAGASGAGVASALVLLIATVMRGWLSAPVDQEVFLILRDGAMLGARNAVGVLVAALGLLLILRFLEGERRREQQQELSASPAGHPDYPRV